MAGLALVAPLARAALAAPRMRAEGGCCLQQVVRRSRATSARAIVACALVPLVLARVTDTGRCSTTRKVFFLNAGCGCETIVEAMIALDIMVLLLQQDAMAYVHTVSRS